MSLRAVGYQQITSLATAVSLTVPAGAGLVIMTPQTQAIRYRDDGTAPTATVGHPIAVGQDFRLEASSLSRIQVIEQTASAALNVTYYAAD